MAYSIETVGSSPTRWIYLDGRLVGFLLVPLPAEPSWQVLPRVGCEAFMPDGRCEYETRQFASEPEALAYLGIQTAQEAA
jgi:hypothetical protein